VYLYTKFPYKNTEAYRTVPSDTLVEARIQASLQLQAQLLPTTAALYIQVSVATN
jgi:hypothetical protein